MREPNEKSVILAVLLNALIPGAGYMYMGRVGLGILVLIAVPIVIVASGGIAWVPWMLVMCIDMLLLQRKRRQEFEATLKKCPACAELVQREALVCKHCRHQFGAPPAVS